LASYRQVKSGPNRHVFHVTRRRIRIEGLDQVLLHRFPDQSGDAAGRGGFQSEPLAQGAVGELFALDLLDAGVDVMDRMFMVIAPCRDVSRDRQPSRRPLSGCEPIIT